MTVELVKFWAPWCGSCRLFAPTVNRFAEAHEAALAYREVDLSVDPSEAEDRGVATLPTLLFLRDGAEIHRIVGAVPYQKLEEQASAILAT
jgi:thioredoxin 1